jgi:hypothetical protein
MLLAAQKVAMAMRIYRMSHFVSVPDLQRNGA